MSDEFPGGDDSASTSFQAWLDQQAENQGVTREELFEQLVSSYWTLNEMTQLLDDSGGSGAPMPRSRDRSDVASGPADADGTARRPSDRRGGADAPTDAPQRDERAGERRRGEPESASDAPAHSEDRDDGLDDRLEDRLDDVEAQLDELDSAVETEVEHGRTLDQLLDALADRLTEVEGDLDEVAATAESTQASLSERIEALELELTERQDALEAEQDQVESWLDTEFDSLRTILEYLLDRTDGLEREVETAGARRERELERLRAEREAIQSIKRDAASHDAHEGECEACGETIDLDLLTRPYCPHCDATLTGVETERRLWLFTDFVVTARGPGDGEGRRGSSSGGSRPSPSTGERSAPLPSRERDRERAGENERDRRTEEVPDVGSDSDRERNRDARPSDGRNGRVDDGAERPPESLDLESSVGGRGDREQSGERDGGDRGASIGTDDADAADATAGNSESGSAFEFGAPSDSTDGGEPSGAADSDAEPTQRDSPFGDLADLRREESDEDGA